MSPESQEGIPTAFPAWASTTIQSDVVLTGGPSWNEGNTWIGQAGNGTLYNTTWRPKWSLGLAYPCSGVSVINNHHNGITSGAAAYLLVAAARVRFSGNTIGAHYGAHAQAPYDRGDVTRECGPAPNALAAVGTDPYIFLVRHVTFDSNDGWCYTANVHGNGGPTPALSNGGLIQILGSGLPDGNVSSVAQATLPFTFDWDTWSIRDTPDLWGFNSHQGDVLPPPFDGRSATYWAGWPSMGVGRPKVSLAAEEGLGGHRVLEVSCALECLLPLSRANLAMSPSIAGQAVYMALQIQVTSVDMHTYSGASLPLRLEIFDGTRWQYSANASHVVGGWRMHTFMSHISWNSSQYDGSALFQLRMGGPGANATQYGGNATLLLGRAVIAPVGHAWDRA